MQRHVCGSDQFGTHAQHVASVHTAAFSDVHVAGLGIVHDCDAQHAVRAYEHQEHVTQKQVHVTAYEFVQEVRVRVDVVFVLRTDLAWTVPALLVKGRSAVGQKRHDAARTAKLARRHRQDDDVTGLMNAALATRTKSVHSLHKRTLEYMRTLPRSLLW